MRKRREIDLVNTRTKKKSHNVNGERKVLKNGDKKIGNRKREKKKIDKKAR